ncbi:Beta-galactosidase trimerisation domain-containing protein [Paenibacillus sp. 1_12]|uniref:alpha-amylase family protein n=1 Tax=Paenibacillus sp. 1_12 TaxID=1566278 RepID=UPI0008F34209|nr:alpha-amylase family protein [Paenibacillus sp. 1_12]SFK79028.1 Beta-galactosidase trimerisation domain-containing protein [Paenibacillus sp. 1_12]
MTTDQTKLTELTATNEESPWFERTVRWGQTNLTEMDPVNWDKEFWKDYWKQTKVQGVIINAGGIVAYYPSDQAMQYRAVGLGDTDLFGEFTAEARKAGLVVLARMDINRATQDFYDAHPDWFVVNAKGEPAQSNGRYFSCVNSPYYKEYIPEVLKEIIAKYKPEGFTDNSWTGASRKIICHCGYCKSKFKADADLELPTTANYDDPVYRKWITWSYNCRIENWDLFNAVTQEFGGPDCLWLGMFNADPLRPHTNFCDLKEVGQRSKIIMCDHQTRDNMTGFEQNSLNGYLLHSLAGWDTLIPESMSNYVRGVRTFRQGSNPSKETQLWMLDGIAGGISPWYHHVGALQEDRRQYQNAPPVMQWHEQNEAYLYNRLPVANIGLLWSQENTEFYGRDEVEERVTLPWHGFARAMTRARIPFVPVHADHIAREASKLDVLILPDLAAMTDSQCEAVRTFVESGGSLVFTGVSATLNEWGEVRESFPLQSITGIQHLHKVDGVVGKSSPDWEVYDAHNYLRIPQERHAVFAEFDNTAILPFGGTVHRVETNEQLKAIATYIPSYPIYPPEFSWVREPHTDIPVMFTGEHASGGRLFYFAGDIDRCYGRTHLPDLGDLLAHAVQWAAADKTPVKIQGPGYLDCKLYRQGERLLLHVINLSGTNQTHGYIEEFLPIGPIQISFKVDGWIPQRASLRVSHVEIKPEAKDSWATIQIDSIVSHEFVVLE